MGSGLGFQRGGSQFTKRWKSECLVNKCLLGQWSQWDAEWNSNKQTRLDSSLSPHLVLTVVISGDSSLPGTGPRSAFFQTVQVR